MTRTGYAMTSTEGSSRHLPVVRSNACLYTGDVTFGVSPFEPTIPRDSTDLYPLLELIDGARPGDAVEETHETYYPRIP